MGSGFDAYASWYDLLYSDKDYAGEARYVADRIAAACPDAKSILELGSGTGAHAAHLAEAGFAVTGIDSSRGMHDRAVARRSRLPAEVAARLDFHVGDLREFRLPQRFDAVIALFHVISFLTTPDDLRAAFHTAAAHLKAGGVFLFDFWYGPAVLAQRPSRTTKRIAGSIGSVSRVSEPVLDRDTSTVQVVSAIAVEPPTGSDDSAARTVVARHTMRYWFPDELHTAAAGLFAVISTDAWMTHIPANPHSWSAVGIMVRNPMDATQR